MTVRLTVLLIATVAMGVAIAGCGDSSSETEADGGDSGAITVTASSLTKVQFLKQADDACKAERAKLLPRITRYSRENPDAPAAEETPAYAGLVEAAMLPTFQAELDAVRALGAPGGEEAKVEAILTAQQEAIDDLAEQDVESFLEVEKAFGEASRLLYDYRLSGCSVGDPVPSREG